MVVLDESKEHFVLNVRPYVDEVEAKLRAEERKRTGRYLALTVALFLIGIGLYHTISNVASKMSALISASMIMLFYLLWLLYASQRRKHKLKRDDLHAEKQVSSVLENLNNIRSLQTSTGPHDNYVYASSEDEVERKIVKNPLKLKPNIPAVHSASKTCNRSSAEAEVVANSLKVPSRNTYVRCSDGFIRTYSIA